jgi:dTDP-glucose 4,6-dehydratase
MAEAGTPGEVYNVGGAGGLANLEVASRILQMVGRPASLLQHVADRPGHDRRYALDDSKIRAALGYAPRHTLEDGLAETVTWYVAHPEWWRPIKSGEFRSFYETWYART